MNDEQQIIEPVPTMAGYKKIPTFKLWIANQFPYIETDFDAITNYELLQAVIKYLNTIIENENNVESNVTALYNAFVNLHDYVENFFDNLDVQEEINNKLDKMVEDGTIESLLLNYSQVAKVFDTYNDMMLDTSTYVTGMKLKTLGYHYINDGGGAEYIVTNIQNDNKYQVNIGTNLWIEMIIKDSVNVKQFGAYGDGVNDDTLFIQNSLNFSKNVFLPKGIYKITQLIINQYQVLKGCGRNSVLKSTLDNTNNDIFAIVIPASADRVILKDFRVYGGIDNATTGTAVVQDVNNTFENIAIDSGYGFKVHQRGNYLNNIRCGNTKYGIHITGTDNIIESCVTAVTDSHGLWIQGANNNVNNSKSFIAGNKEYGIGIYITSSFNRLNGCEAQQNKYENYFIQNCYGSNICGCTSDGAFYHNNVSNYQNTIFNQNINSSSIFLHNIKSCIIDIVNINGSFDTNPTEVIGFLYHSLIEKCKLSINSYNRDNTHINVISTKELYILCANNTCTFNGVDFNAYTNMQNYYHKFTTSFEQNTQTTNKVATIKLSNDTNYIALHIGTVGDKTNIQAAWVDVMCVVQKDGVTKYETTSQQVINSNETIGIDIKNFLSTKDYDTITGMSCRIIAMNKENVEAFTFEIDDVLTCSTESQLPSSF